MWGAKCLLLALLGSMFIAPSHGVITEELSSAINDFTVNFLRASFNSANRNNNAILSPLGLYTDLAMVQQGAAGSTQNELNEVLHAQSTSTKEGLKILIEYLKEPHPTVELKFATKLFLKSGLNFLPDFKNISVEDFKSDIENLDFSQDTAAAQTINSWVSQNTNQRIQNIITSDNITPSTVLLLLNAVYFSGHWNNQFTAEATIPKEFFTLGGETKNVLTMHYSRMIVKTGNCSCVNAKFVQLPFQQSEYSMLLVVPDGRDGLLHVVNNLPGQKLLEFIKSNNPNRVTLELPKFKFETTSELKDKLQVMGLHDTFTDSAKFPGISGSPLKLTGARQKAEIEVNEYGVKTSTGTGTVTETIRGRTNMLFTEVEEPLEIKADHPFIFFIVDNANKVPLLSGWVGQP